MDLFVDHQYLVLPVNPNAAQKKMLFYHDGKLIYELDAQIDQHDTRHHYCIDMSRFRGLTLRMAIEPKMDFIPITSDTESCEQAFGANTQETLETVSMYDEPYRPQVHFTARKGWLNDPNGLCYVNGHYHLFFQFNPAGAKWGNMHWGHAVSKDLIHWKELPPALYPDETGTMFSGCAYVDHNNRSGFGKKGQPPVFLFYTAAGNRSRMSAGRAFTQCLAYSTDECKTFVKYARNPIIGQFIKGNRDPKVVFCPELNQYLMALYLDKSDYMILSSDNLVDWREMQRLELEGDGECPDFYRIPVENEPGVYKWVFAGASDYYLVGSIQEEEKLFIPEQPIARYFHGNRGSYAGQTYNNTGERIIRMTWQNVHCPDSPFEGQIGLPCDVSLVRMGRQYFLKSQPVKSVKALRSTPMVIKPGEYEIGRVCGEPSSDCRAYELLIRTQNRQQVFQLSFFGFNLLVDGEKNQICLNEEQMPLTISSGHIDIRLIIDVCGIELFADNGLIYSAVSHICDYNQNKIKMTLEPHMHIDDICLYPLKSIRTDTETNQ